MNPSPRQLDILTAHVDGPLPFIAKGSRSQRTLVAQGLLSFNGASTKTRLTKAGRSLLARQSWRAAIKVAAPAESHP
jgi:hypothetical protein